MAQHAMSDAISKMHAEVAPRAQVELRLPGNQDGDDADQDWADELEWLEDGEAVRLIREASIMQLACNQHTLGPLHRPSLGLGLGRLACNQHTLGPFIRPSFLKRKRRPSQTTAVLRANQRPSDVIQQQSAEVTGGDSGRFGQIRADSHHEASPLTVEANSMREPMIVWKVLTLVTSRLKPKKERSWPRPIVIAAEAEKAEITGGASSSRMYPNLVTPMTKLKTPQ